MKKYVILLISTALVIACVFTGANLFAPPVTEVTIYTAQVSEVENTVKCSGKIEETNKKDVVLDTPVVASEVKVAVGDTVTEGQPLFYVDQQATFTLLSYSNSMGLSQDVLGSLGTSGSSLPSSSKQQGSAVESVDDIPGVVKAPISGTVTSINVSQSGLTTPGTAVVTISNLDSLQVKVSINESKIGDVAVGQPVSITGTAFKDHTYTGTIQKIFPSARQQLNGAAYETVVDAIVSIDGADEYLKPNYNVEASITTSQLSQSILVPYEAVRQDEEGNEYVYIYSMAQAHRVDVTTGRELTDGVEITGGLKAGDKVILNPDDVTGHGVRVKLANGVDADA